MERGERGGERDVLQNWSLGPYWVLTLEAPPFIKVGVTWVEAWDEVVEFDEELDGVRLACLLLSWSNWSNDDDDGTFWLLLLLLEFWFWTLVEESEDSVHPAITPVAAAVSLEEIKLANLCFSLRKGTSYWLGTMPLMLDSKK